MTGIASIRQDAARRFAELGFPTTRDEEWRFTNVSSIAKTQFSAAPSDLNAREVAQFDQSLSPNEGGPRLVFINGRYSPELSTPEASTGHPCHSAARSERGRRSAPGALRGLPGSCVCCVEYR